MTRIKTYALYGLFIFALNSTPPVFSDEPLEVIKYYTGGWSTLMARHQIEAVDLLMELSKEQFGPYKLEESSSELTDDRMYREVAIGEKINSGLTGKLRSPEARLDVFQLMVPYYHGILGLRKLIVHKTEYDRISQINSVEAFKELSVGQGAQWGEVVVYKHSDIRLYESTTFANLFPMLQLRRFDYLPLGILEIDSALKKHKNKTQDLVIVENMYIFYPFPTFLNIHGENSCLTDRLKFGLSQAIETERLQLLFYKYFSEHLKYLTKQPAKVFILENPILNKQQNKQAIDSALQTFFSKGSQFYYLDQI